MSSKKVVKDEDISFSPDSGLLYCIQQVTKQPSDEILGFFYDFGKEVLVQGVANMTGRSIRKDIRAVYPGTAIPFKLLVESDRYYYQNDTEIGGTIYIEFPDNPDYMDTEELMNIIMERQLLGGSSLPDFEAPRERIPKMYKDLIDKILTKGKEDEIVSHSGHTRETGSAEETVGGPSPKPRSRSKRR